MVAGRIALKREGLFVAGDARERDGASLLDEGDGERFGVEFVADGKIERDDSVFGNVDCVQKQPRRMPGRIGTRFRRLSPRAFGHGAKHGLGVVKWGDNHGETVFLVPGA